MRKSSLLRFINGFLILALILVFSNLGILPAFAANITTFSDNVTRLQTSTLADHTIKFITPTGVAAGQTITLTFAAGFVMGTFAVTNVDVATAATCGGSFTDKTLAASPSGTTWGVAQSGQIITITSGTDTIAATNCVRVLIGANAVVGGAGVSQITNPSSAALATLAVGGTFGDAGTAGIPIITNDQVTVTATVNPTLAFATSANAIGFGALTTANVRYATSDTLGSNSTVAAHTITVSTNATSGYNVYVQGATLTSGANTIAAIGGSATASTPASEQFGLSVAAAGGTGTATAPYNTANFAYAATGTTQSAVASAAGPSATTTFSITYIANIAAVTKAGSYTTSLTYIAVGSF